MLISVVCSIFIKFSLQIVKFLSDINFKLNSNNWDNLTGLQKKNEEISLLYFNQYFLAASQRTDLMGKCLHLDYILGMGLSKWIKVKVYKHAFFSDFSSQDLGVRE